MSDESNLYEPLDSLLTNYGSIMGASEYHGLLVGAICCGADETTWLALAEDNLDLPEATPESLTVAGKEMYAVFNKQLAERDFQFQLLLPPVEVELSLSARCLGEWVTGFLAALGEQGVRADKLTEDTKELLNDMAAIAQISIEGDSGSDQDFIEVVEYVRVAVFSLFEELTQGGEKAPTVH
ncbi:UPF0149 family protein [Halioxenophilus aromaticivorans]|uniref:YecA family protein n=1 Tax=Halioxenophilus aromaticivorans TaxID=1306992 RepID=A0AAV3U5E6_9ALTE